MGMYPEYKCKAREANESDFKNIATIDFPRVVTKEECFIKNERQFHLLLSISKSIQRSLGWAAILNSNVFYPDLTAMLIGGEILKCEVEYNASNFLKHKHSGRFCDLIVSFIRQPHQEMIAGIPVWAFYEIDENVMRWTLNRDIKHNGYMDDLDYGFMSDDSRASEIDE